MKPILFKAACLISFTCSFFSNQSIAQNAFLNEGSSIHLESAAAIYIQGNLENKNTGNFTNAGVLHISGNLIHNASVNLNAASTGLFRFNGTGNQIISGNNQPNFYNLTVEKSGGECQLQTGITLNNLLTLTSGSMFLNNQQIDLLTTGSLINETSTNRIYDITTGTGTIKIVRTLNAPVAVNPGNLGAIITSLQNFGSTTIIRGHNAQFIVSANSINRHYTITPTLNSSLNATLRFTYFDNELNGQTESEQVQWHLPNGSSVWNKRGGTVNTSSNYVDLAGISSFDSKQSLISNNIVPLPLHLLEFKAEKTTTGKVLLTWKTADEINSSHFDIERSLTGLSWEKIGMVITVGQPGAIQSYQLTDYSPSANYNYYRLKQVDIDNRFEYSPVRLVMFDNSTTIKVYPTLTKERSQIYVSGISPEKILVELYDSKGSLLLQTKMYSNSFLLPKLSPGIYHLKLIEINNHKAVNTAQLFIH
ncbi:hypothetical protein CAP36_02270 [Chitinophagaceae bacterium IBVUCB2]|nr:hypothetical protein CAP36_02270 [Chitinophagaceae bacterium IBVUCB2]